MFRVVYRLPKTCQDGKNKQFSKIFSALSKLLHFGGIVVVIQAFFAPGVANPFVPITPARIIAAPIKW